MRFRTVRIDGRNATIGRDMDDAWVLVDPSRAVDESLRTGTLREWMHEGKLDLSTRSPLGQPVPRPEALVRNPALLLGIGLNYREHAGDLDERAPSEPASFLKGTHTLIGAGEPIVIPLGSTRVTAEAELGLVIGRTAYNVSEDDALAYIAGVCLVLDQTEEEVLRRNPRFLTRAKNYPTFLSLGPDLITLDEVYATAGPLPSLTVSTTRGADTRSNVVANMTFSPEYLLAFHSHVMPLRPGDVISTGTPGALVITPGDQVTAEISGLGTLQNPVVSATAVAAHGSTWDE